MKSKGLGKIASEVEVTQIDTMGIWVLCGDKEYFLAFERFPSFRDATVGSIHNVEIMKSGKVRWPQLGVEIALESLGDPQTVSRVCD